MDIKSERCDYSIGQTGTEFTNLEPVRVCIRAGAAITQDYLTTEQARELAYALLGVVAGIEALTCTMI